MEATKTAAAGEVIAAACERTGFTRSHVAAIMRRYADTLGAEKVGARWRIRSDRVGLLEQLVRSKSGKKRKLGERD